MITVLRWGDIELPQVPNDDQHWGDPDTRYKTVFAFPDGKVDVGMWEFKGTGGAVSQDGYDDIVIILEGTLTLTYGDETHVLGPHDVAIFQSPMPQKSATSPGFKAIWVTYRR